jgi:peptide methionine sulfoxide reductase msrA/msrB
LNQPGGKSEQFRHFCEKIPTRGEIMHSFSPLPPNPNQQSDYSGKKLKDIWLAGGCFWGVEAYMTRLPGVAETSVGYANGLTENPAYRDVCSHQTGHAETVHIRYDPSRISLENLLGYFFQIIDPTSKNRQGNDKGTQYRTGIYYRDENDLSPIRAAVAAEQKKHSQPIVTEIEPLRQFFLAEDEHQAYLEKNPYGYCHVSFASLPKKSFALPKQPQIDPARYPKPDDGERRARLTPEQYRVTQSSATERPFTGEYWQHDEPGLYVDIVTGEPLFYSTDKFDAGCGWPSFSKPVDPAVILEKRDLSHGYDRVEVRSRAGDSHLGHVFTDGPAERGGLRYCINSAAIRFVPLSEMAAAGYAELMPFINQPHLKKTGDHPDD